MKKNKIIIVSIIIISLLISGGILCWQKIKQIELKPQDHNKEIYKTEENFEMSKVKEFGGCKIIGRYCKNDKVVYYRHVEVEGADSIYFEDLGDGYARDDDQIFYKGTEIENVDLESFEEVNRWSSNVFMDKNRGYFNGGFIKKDEVAKIADFMVNNFGGENLGNNYKKFCNVIYFWQEGGRQAAPNMKRVEDANPETFVSIDNKSCIEGLYNGLCTKYGKDNKNVFFDGYKQEELNPETFNPNSVNSE